MPLRSSSALAVHLSRAARSVRIVVRGAGLAATMSRYLLVIVAMGIGPILGHFAGRWPYRRSIPVLWIVGATVVTWSLVLAGPGRAPLALLVVLVVVLASNGPGSLTGFDYARTVMRLWRGRRDRQR
jgi:MFS-type transporter involved in bile tolerance (Atg22 family)